MTDDSMKRLTAMAKVLHETKQEIIAVSERLKKLQTDESLIETEDMPELMRELEMKNFTLLDGTKIEVLEDLKCGISEANRPAAHDWLRDNKFGGIITTVLSVSYAPGEVELAAEHAEEISKLTGRETSVAESIHHSRLKSFLKEQRKKGTKIPQLLFGLFPFSKAKVTPPKE